MAVDSLIKIHESKLPGDVPTSEARSNLRTGRDKVDHYMIQKDEHTCLVLPLAPITTCCDYTNLGSSLRCTLYTTVPSIQ